MYLRNPLLRIQMFDVEKEAGLFSEWSVMVLLGTRPASQMHYVLKGRQELVISASWGHTLFFLVVQHYDQQMHIEIMKAMTKKIHDLNVISLKLMGHSTFTASQILFLDNQGRKLSSWM